MPVRVCVSSIFSVYLSMILASLVRALLSPPPLYLHPNRVPPRPSQGTGRYAIYIANYASGNVGPHALIEMDESASDLSQGVIALSNVAEEAGVNKFTGGCGEESVARTRDAGREPGACRMAVVHGSEGRVSDEGERERTRRRPVFLDFFFFF